MKSCSWAKSQRPSEIDSCGCHPDRTQGTAISLKQLLIIIKSFSHVKRDSHPFL